jgi:hypothetical protein
MSSFFAGHSRRWRAAAVARHAISSVPTNSLPIARRSAWLFSGSTQLSPELSLPAPASRCTAWVILPRAGGQSALQPPVLPAVHRAGFATLVVDLLMKLRLKPTSTSVGGE